MSATWIVEMRIMLLSSCIRGRAAPPRGLLAIAGGAAVVQDDLPAPVGLAAPGRVVGAGSLAVGIPYGTRADRQGARIEDLDALRLPREGGLRPLVEAPPRLGDLLLPAQRAVRGQEDRLVGQEGRERRMIPVGHRLGEGPLRLADLALEVCRGGRHRAG